MDHMDQKNKSITANEDLRTTVNAQMLSGLTEISNSKKQIKIRKKVIKKEK